MLDPNQPSARRPGAFDAMEGILEDDNEDSAGSVIPESAAPEVRKGKRRMSLDVDPSRPTPLPEPVDGPSLGAFTNEEKAATDAVLEHYCQLYHLDSDEQRSNMIDWKKLDPELKDYLNGCLPNRKKVAVRKFCQRRYISKTEGAWTAEEDGLLLEWHTVYGAKWAEIADHVHGRMPGQCRDRYRNHLQHGDKAQTGAWSQDEESVLVKVVAESIEQIRQANIDNGGLVNEAEDLEKLVPWNVVSDKMGGTRTRKKCLEKWHNLMRRNPSLLNTLADADPPAPTATALKFDPQSKKQRLAAKRFEAFQNGDIHDVLCEIHTAITNHTKTYADETTLWSLISQANKDSRFDAPLRRLAYHESLETYGTKKSVQMASTIAAKAKAMAEWMERYNLRHNEEFVRGYAPTPVIKKPKKPKKEPIENDDSSDHGEDGAPARKRRKARERMIAAGKVDEQCAEVADVLQREPRSLPRSKTRRLQLSTEMVENSDDDEEDVDVKNASVSAATKPESLETDSSSSESGSHDESNRSVDDLPQISPPESLDLPSSPPAGALPADDPPAYNDAVATDVDEAPDEHGDPFDVVSMSSRNSRLTLPGRKSFIARFACLTAGICAYASDPVVNLGYAQYRGTPNDTFGVTSFFGIRYAVSPTGARRWQPPQPIEYNNEYSKSAVIDATQQGPICIQSTPYWNITNTSSIPIQPGDEDCLLLDIQVPANPANDNLDVMVQIHGGGYVGGNAESYPGYALVNQSVGNIIYVSIQYRLGALGFLAGSKIRDNGVANAGLLDQRTALHWVQRHIHSFGGDPSKVTIMGGSAGGGAVLNQMILYGGVEDPPFRAVISERPWVQTYHNNTVLDIQFQELLDATSCADLACLRLISTDALNVGQQVALVNGYLNHPRLYGFGDYWYGPTVDGKHIRDFPSRELENGHFTKVPLLVDTEGYEGFLFSNQSQRTMADETTDLQTIFPYAKNSFFTRLYEVYPVAAFNSTLFQRQSIYGDYIINCPTYYMASAMSDYGLPSYKLVFNAGTELHGATRPFLHNTNSSTINNATLALTMKDWYLSFALHQDPNAQSFSNASKPYWPQYNPPGSMNFTVMDVNYTMVGAVEDFWASGGCDFFRSQSSVVRN
ncbi:hypothetical protein LTS12_005117 [Elasticomyces elasticus]|nr:hypothetical protein LTS12_005117 [Elasticomyces elasticus]